MKEIFNDSGTFSIPETFSDSANGDEKGEKKMRTKDGSRKIPGGVLLRSKTKAPEHKDEVKNDTERTDDKMEDVPESAGARETSTESDKVVSPHSVKWKAGMRTIGDEESE